MRIRIQKSQLIYLFLIFLLSFSLFTVNKLNEGIELEKKELIQKERLLRKSLRKIEKEIKLIKNFERLGKSLIQNRLDVMDSKKEALTLYENFRKKFYVNAFISSPQIKRNMLVFEVKIENNPELWRKILDFGQGIYFRLINFTIDFERKKNLIFLKGFIFFKKW